MTLQAAQQSTECLDTPPESGLLRPEMDIESQTGAALPDF